MFTEILLAQGAKTACLEPTLEALGMEGMLAKQVGQSLSRFGRILLQADRAILKRAVFVKLKVGGRLEVLSSVLIGNIYPHFYRIDRGPI